jgi:LmbE family N-acetylglucosaminyl deacetylase
MRLFLAPHNDDEVLFGSFTLMRYRSEMVLVILTDSFIQGNRGDGITAQQRRDETFNATSHLHYKENQYNYPLTYAGLPDDKLTQKMVELWLKNANYKPDVVYAPMPYSSGNEQHNMVGNAALDVYGNKVIFYSTYTKDKLYMTGELEIIPTEMELKKKQIALQCYKSQLSLPSTRPHFEAVLGKSEWYA